MTNHEIAQLRDLTASQMLCDCGEPLAITKQGALCPSPKCIGRASHQVTISSYRRNGFRSGGIVPTATLARAWPERVVGHDRTDGQRLNSLNKDWSCWVERTADPT